MTSLALSLQLFQWISFDCPTPGTQTLAFRRRVGGEVALCDNNALEVTRSDLKVHLVPQVPQAGVNGGSGNAGAGYLTAGRG